MTTDLIENPKELKQFLTDYKILLCEQQGSFFSRKSRPKRLIFLPWRGTFLVEIPAWRGLQDATIQGIDFDTAVDIYNNH